MRTVSLFNHHVHSVYYLLAVIEGLLFIAAFYLGAQLYFLQEQAEMAEHITSILPRALVFALVSLAAMVAVGLYKPHLREGSSGVLLRLMSAFVLTILGMSLVFYLLPNLHLWRGVFAQSLLVAFVFSLLSRATFSRLVDNEQLKSRVLVLGTGWRANTALGWLRRDSDRRSFRFVGFVRSNGEPVQVEGQNIVESDVPLEALADSLDIDQIVVALDDRRNALPIDALVKCRLAGIEVLDVATFFEREAGKIMLDFVSPSWLVFSDGFKQSTWRQASKRLFDIVASLALLMIVWPVMMLTLLAIWLEDGFGTPAIYRQQRVGLYGRVFDLLKLRSMRVDAEGDGKARWAAKNDGRITRVGSVIRRLRIDELPQILNILRGDMSLVGPRPERPEFVRQLEQGIPFYSARHQVKPGIAGWAQLHYPYGASEEDARQKLQYELYYIKNHSVFLDFMIILSTTEVVLFGEGVR
ncbi:TIGR03013 family XrtA/PEP-CTERM system glycosyltransferase [Parahaliea mediterranea]|uniref:TIGR03013 family XrtA/PEP-CTERM system glycosyltransferase n=1 Tax=Parahaliea mediterranea TaxID=651086 RepID=UPI000E2F6EEF|nr:TIGR03013 family XrtA/PEP-CTERM system glycosyltransferase [Parahaliea mediterranea]